MIFGGETLAGKNIAPGTPPASLSPFIGDYFQPSRSNIITVAVQEEPITFPGVVPLPSNYWTRPIYGENNNWYTITGNWLGLASSTFAATGMYNASGNYNPYTTAPNTAHILWTKPEAFGGIIGGEFGGTETGNYYSTSQYDNYARHTLLHSVPGKFNLPSRVERSRPSHRANNLDKKHNYRSSKMRPNNKHDNTKPVRCFSLFVGNTSEWRWSRGRA
jgi:hypothetical protein